MDQRRGSKVIIVCKNCGKEAERSHLGGAKYCLPCARTVNKERDRERLKLRKKKGENEHTKNNNSSIA